MLQTMKRILVTGATGFIGCHSLPLLMDHGYEVHAVSSKDKGSYYPGVRWHKSNLLDFKQTEALLRNVRPTHLLHFAWYTIPGEFWNSQENLCWLQASIHLLRKFVEQNGRRAVFAGTCAEYNWNFGFCSESITPCEPATLYGTCKHSMRLILESYAKETGLSAAWGRIFFPFGPYEHPDRVVPYVIRSLLKGEFAACSHGNQIRDFLYVEDVAEAFVKIMESSVCGPVNVGSGQPIVLKDLIFKIAEVLDRPDLIKLGSRSTSHDEAPLVLANVGRLYSEIKWQPKYDLDQAINKSVEWWQENMSNP